MTDLFAQPETQLYIYLSLLTAIAIFSKLDEAAIIRHGTNAILIWMPISGIFGISPNAPWGYYLKLTVFLLIGYVSLWIAALVADKFGREYSGEGSMLILVPLFCYVCLMVPITLVKFIWQILT